MYYIGCSGTGIYSSQLSTWYGFKSDGINKVSGRYELLASQNALNGIEHIASKTYIVLV
ncbi:uncharacterized protein PHALS_11269 [Plasmopara halstedii]|uniref:Uncharacterized protein n=1 Tax=Plasmopara halstedii TaxID=4781 RepID=A0A0P1AJT3_PLAHL|nr:uncharacterized protein PHALS_11269 [Plasmopara halstedii]CEG41104.1 hypothetical protein PHALS_11269 [Plasmopara halstedii]|eukprot:XP_024577473.1 hypothetical protein PHALS_11269 [Plasmopara halstedii]